MCAHGRIAAHRLLAVLAVAVVAVATEEQPGTGCSYDDRSRDFVVKRLPSWVPERPEDVEDAEQVEPYQRLEVPLANKSNEREPDE